jgi:hypothetical protein
MLRLLSDQRKFIVKNIREMPILGSYLGGVMEFDDHIDIYCDLSRPEMVCQAVLVHEILHVILGREGFPKIIIDVDMLPRLSLQQQEQLPKIRDRFKSAIDHPEIFKRMSSRFEMDLNAYFDAQVEQKLRMFESGSRISGQRDQNYYFQRQQDIMWGIELFWYPSRQRDQIQSAFQRVHLDSYQSCFSLYSRIKRTGFETPISCYESAQAMKSHIISYGENRNIGVPNRMWEALDVQKPGVTT